MTRRKYAISLALLGSLSLVPFANADFISASATIPTPGTVIASDFNSGLTFTASTNPNYYTDLYVGHGNNIAAETFTTGATPTSFGSYTILDADNGDGGFSDGNTEFVLIAPATPGNGTSNNTFGAGHLYSSIVPTGTGAATGDYITYTLSSPLPLAANTTYLVGWYSSSAYSGFGVSSTGGTATADLAVAIGSTPTSPQNGGTYITYSGVGTPTAYTTSDSGTDVEAFQITTPEPAALGMLALASLAFLSRRRRI